MSRFRRRIVEKLIFRLDDFRTSQNFLRQKYHEPSFIVVLFNYLLWLTKNFNLPQQVSFLIFWFWIVTWFETQSNTVIILLSINYLAVHLRKSTFVFLLCYDSESHRNCFHCFKFGFVDLRSNLRMTIWGLRFNFWVYDWFFLLNTLSYYLQNYLWWVDFE